MISVAIEDGSWIDIYDEEGDKIGSVPRCDGLVGFTARSVSVKDGSWIDIYDEEGHQTGGIPV